MSIKENKKANEMTSRIKIVVKGVYCSNANLDQMNDPPQKSMAKKAAIWTLALCIVNL